MEKCTRCSGQVTDRVRYIEKTPYHYACVLCSVCNKEISEGGVFRHNGNLVCKEHKSGPNTVASAPSSGSESKASAPSPAPSDDICFSCKKTLENEYITCLGRSYHKTGCLTCFNCNCVLENGKLFVGPGSIPACHAHAEVTETQINSDAPPTGGQGNGPRAGEKLTSTREETIHNNDGSRVEIVEHTYQDDAGNLRTVKTTKHLNIPVKK